MLEADVYMHEHRHYCKNDIDRAFLPSLYRNLPHAWVLLSLEKKHPQSIAK